ncbi:hypothetical protein GCM10027568_27070 [Humibacter soli]
MADDSARAGSRSGGGADVHVDDACEIEWQGDVQQLSRGDMAEPLACTEPRNVDARSLESVLEVETNASNPMEGAVEIR